MKLIWQFILWGVIGSLTAVAAQAPESSLVPLSINGRLTDTPQAALMIDGRLLLGSTALSNDLGLTVTRQADGQWLLAAFGRRLALRPDSPRYTLDGETLMAPHSPLLRGDELFVPIAVLVEPFSLTITRGEVWSVLTPAARLGSLRQGHHPDKIRFVLDLSQQTLFRWRNEPGRLVLEFPAATEIAARQGYLRLHTFADPLAEQILETVEEGQMRLVISHQSSVPPAVFTLCDPARIVIDLWRAPPQCTPEPQLEVAPGSGDIWRLQTFSGRKGPVRGFVLRFNPRTAPYELRPMLAGTTIMKRALVSRLVSQHKAYAGLNGGFFSTAGPPLGMLVIDGRWVKAPLYGRAVLGCNRQGEWQIKRVDFTGRLEVEGAGFLPLEGINQGHQAEHSVVAFSCHYGESLPGAPGKTRLVVGADGKVVSVVSPNQPAAVPEGGWVISGHGQRSQTLAKIAPGTRVEVKLQCQPEWPDLYQALGGGPLLVVDGQVRVNGQQERFRNDVTTGSRPRSAVGLTATGEIILLAVENPGLTLTEVASIMVKAGAQSAMNLDGGGSTAFVVGDKLLNRPADGCERAVSNALLVLPRPVAKADEVK
jgi:hypothetical protein